MAQPKVERLITAIDIGSWKVSALIAGRTDTGELAILGTGQRESRGVRRGFIADMERTELAVRETVEQAERVAGTNIEDVWVSFSGGSLVSDVVTVERDMGGYRVEQPDIDDLLTTGQQGIDPDGRIILHAQPTCFTINGKVPVKKPLGMHADLLGVDIHVIFADGAPVRNIDQTVAAAYLGVSGIVAAPIAAGTAVLGEEERELGVALVEMGVAVGDPLDELGFNHRWIITICIKIIFQRQAARAPVARQAASRPADPPHARSSPRAWARYPPSRPTAPARTRPRQPARRGRTPQDGRGGIALRACRHRYFDRPLHRDGDAAGAARHRVLAAGTARDRLPGRDP
mgnify:CR=1 FL=1